MPFGHTRTARRRRRLQLVCKPHRRPRFVLKPIKGVVSGKHVKKRKVFGGGGSHQRTRLCLACSLFSGKIQRNSPNLTPKLSGASAFERRIQSLTARIRWTSKQGRFSGKQGTRNRLAGTTPPVSDWIGAETAPQANIILATTVGAGGYSKTRQGNRSMTQCPLIAKFQIPGRKRNVVRYVPILLKNSSSEHFGCIAENAISRPS